TNFRNSSKRRWENCDCSWGLGLGCRLGVLGPGLCPGPGPSPTPQPAAQSHAQALGRIIVAMRPLLLAALVLPASVGAQNIDWPVFGGTTDNTHYSTL